MSVQNRLLAFGSAAGMLILILDSKTALSGASGGIDLCIRTLIPSLFPFFVLSVLLTGALSGQAGKYLRSIGTICKVPEGAESLIAVSILGGYPAGAQNVSVLFGRGQINASQAARLLAFCNNAGPAFIFGVLGSIFPSKATPWYLWLIHLLSAFFVASILPDTNRGSKIRLESTKIRITDALSQGVKVMALVCGWVIFMRIILLFMDVWFLHYLPNPIQIVASGILELSNGCIRLSELENDGLRFLISSGLLSLGGICVTMQTASVAEGIDMRLYYPGKLLQCSISILLSCLFQFSFPPASRLSDSFILATVLIFIIFTAVILHYLKKVVELFNPLVYNQNNYDKEVSLCCFAKK